MESFLCSIHEFLTDAEKFDATNFLCNQFPSADVDDNVVVPRHRINLHASIELKKKL